MNTLFRIAFGDYEFVLDRTNLTYSLTETVTKTVWATNLSLGWIELKERETGAIARTDFSDCKLISIAEKMSAAGKRILLGLDAPGGVPVDIYLICGPKEIQLTVEASRDSKTHLLERVGLLPGLCRVDDTGNLVIPQGEGLLLRSAEVRDGDRLPVWRSWEGLTMPFFGACQPASALALITDSAYATAELSRHSTQSASTNWIFLRDPERRRLDIRIILVPDGDYIAIAHAYREKLIGERNHRTLRKKLRDNPSKAALVGAAFVKVDAHSEGIIQISKYLRLLQDELGMSQAILQLRYNYGHEIPDGEVPQTFKEIKEAGYYAVVRPVDAQDERLTIEESQQAYGGDTAIAYVKFTSVPLTTSWWDFMEQTLAEISKNSSLVSLQGEIGGLDWLAVAADFTLEMLFNGSQQSKKSQSVPLLSAIYRDSVVCFSGVSYFDKTFFLKALLRLNPPYLALPTGIIDGASKEMLTTLRPQVAILCPLHALTFPAFLTAHEFLTPDFLVEEAHYSDKTYVLINQSETELYETGELLLPPGGFYVRHPQFEAHDALRVRTVEFSKRAWRVRRSLDGKPLESSGSIEEREFEVSPP